MSDSATDFFELRGKIKLRLYDYQGAIEDFSICLSLDSSKPDAWFGRGKAYSRLFEEKSAISDYSKAFQLDSNNLDIPLALADSYIALEQYNEAADWIAKAEKLAIDPILVMITKGNYLFGIEDYEGAEKAFTMLIEKFNVPTLFNRDRAYARYWKKDYQGAANDFIAYLKMPDAFKSDFVALASIFIKIGDYENAKHYLDQYTLNLGHNWMSYEISCQIHMATGNYRKAARDLKRMKLLETDSADIKTRLLFETINLYAWKGLKAANEQYQTYINRADTVETLKIYGYGLNLYEEEKYKEALVLFNASIDLHPEIKDAYFERGYCHLQLKNACAALADFDTYLKYNPENSAAYFNKAVILYYQLGNVHEARKMAMKAAGLGYDISDLLYEWDEEINFDD